MKVILHKRAGKTLLSLSEIDQGRSWGYINLFKEKKFTLPGKYLKKLKRGIWELRPGRVRVLFGIAGGDMLIVHIFKKKTQKTLKKDIEIALKRLKEYEL